MPSLRDPFGVKDAQALRAWREEDARLSLECQRAQAFLHGVEAALQSNNPHTVLEHAEAVLSNAQAAAAAHKENKPT